MASLPDIRKLKRIKATCIECRSSRHFGRDVVPDLWVRITLTGKLPATWDMLCRSDECERKQTIHFLDMPDAKKRRS